MSGCSYYSFKILAISNFYSYTLFKIYDKHHPKMMNITDIYTNYLMVQGTMGKSTKVK